MQDHYQCLHPHDLYPDHYHTRNPTQDVSPVAESSADYSMEPVRSRSQAYADHDRYSPAVDYGYTYREYRYPPRGDFNDCSMGIPPQHTRGYYPDPHAHGRRAGYGTADSRWAGHDSHSPYYGPSPNLSSQAEYPGKGPPSA